jgi:hypothetical protein
MLQMTVLYAPCPVRSILNPYLAPGIQLFAQLTQPCSTSSSATAAFNGSTKLPKLSLGCILLSTKSWFPAAVPAVVTDGTAVFMLCRAGSDSLGDWVDLSLTSSSALCKARRSLVFCRTEDILPRMKPIPIVRIANALGKRSSKCQLVHHERPFPSSSQSLI